MFKIASRDGATTVTTKTVIDLHEYLRYDPDTGYVFFNKPVKGRKKPLTEPLGSVGKQGYLQAEIKGVQYKVHRLAWFLYYGHWPAEQIDHINKDKADNRINNLRCGNSINNHNRDMPKGVSGIVGAHWNSRKKKFTSSIKVNGVKEHLGYFNCPTSAHLAYLLEKRKALDV